VVLEKSIFLKISLESREKSLFFQRPEEPWEKVSRVGNRGVTFPHAADMAHIAENEGALLGKCNPN